MTRKTLKPAMFETDFNALLAASAPQRMMLIKIEYGDVEKALEFWLNNVLLRHPVGVEYVRTLRNGDVEIVVTPIQIEEPTA